MNWSALALYFFLGAFGGFVFELIKLYDLHGRLEAAKFRSLWRSQIYRTLAFAMILSAGVLSAILNARTTLEGADFFKVMLSGMGSCGVIRALMSAKVQNGPGTFGSEDSSGGETVSLKELT